MACSTDNARDTGKDAKFASDLCVLRASINSQPAFVRRDGMEISPRPRSLRRRAPANSLGVNKGPAGKGLLGQRARAPPRSRAHKPAGATVAMKIRLGSLGGSSARTYLPA
jgi:hypothetical protein